MIATGVYSKAANTKRSAPLAEHTNQPEAKKQMAMQINQLNMQGMNMQIAATEHQVTPSIMQCAMRATPPYNPSLTLAQNAEIMNSSLGCQNFSMGAGILGAAPPRAQLFNQKNASSSKRRVKRWDVPAQGTTIYTPGAATWKRNTQLSQIYENLPIRIEGTISASPCRSDANSAAAGSFVYEPWPLHTPANSFSQGSQDSRQGIFSPPQMTREFYEAPNYHAGLPQGVELRGSGVQVDEKQMIEAQNNFNQTQGSQNKEVTAEEAEAPAFKAPHAS
jgi:hypothetical protein